MFLHADPTLLLDTHLTQSHNDRIPTQELVALISTPPAFLPREGLLHALTELAAISNHPLIYAGLTGCPYHIKTYRKANLANVDTSFGVQIHHPRFLKCVGAPESARLLGRPPAEWLSIMDCRDALCMALQLQRDAGLMSSNLTELRQYAITLHLRGQLVMLHRYPASFGRPHRWKRWDFGAPWRRIPWLYQVSSVAVRLVVCAGNCSENDCFAFLDRILCI